MALSEGRYQIVETKAKIALEWMVFMDIILWAVIIILAAGAGILSARLWCYKKQIGHIRQELALLEQEDTNHQITSWHPVGKTEEMVADMNRLVVKYRAEGKLLKRENQIYRESITSISHDIRTPLTSAKGYLQMLQKGNVPEEKEREYVQIVEQRLDHVTNMLNQLFEYARIEAGELQLAKEVCNAGNLFTETISLFYHDFVKKGCEPEVVLSQEPCMICGDRNGFVRIIENLIKNALVHGIGNYRLLLEKEQDQVVICVSNETDSIESSDLDKIFDRFYTTDLSRSRKTTGLGLAIVKRFTEQMGGTVKAYLEEKQFTIEVWFPLL